MNALPLTLGWPVYILTHHTLRMMELGLYNDWLAGWLFNPFPKPAPLARASTRSISVAQSISTSHYTPGEGEEVEEEEEEKEKGCPGLPFAMFSTATDHLCSISIYLSIDLSTLGS